MQIFTKTQLRWLSLSVLVIILDQLSKWLVSHYLPYNQPVIILPVFNLTYTLNAGAAFGFLNQASGWQRWLFAGIAIVISAALLRALYQLPRAQNLSACAMALILGGALGNLYDRILYGRVIDFISLHWQNWYFAICNIADTAITFGVIIWLLAMLREKA